jgi:light-regulated signal transduction histidine kinase (bacteriophytochrome)
MRKKLDEFAYLASHDLQEPLRKISTLSEFLKIRYKGTLDEDGCRYLDMITTSVENMRSIIDSLLTFTNINVQAPLFETVDINEVLQSAITDQELRISETGAQVNVSPMPQVEGVATEFRLLLNNLLSNSLKFIGDKKPVISIQSVQLSPDRIKQLNLPDDRVYYQIDLKDNGIGFEKEYAELIFGVFQRLNGKSEYRGFGIGLAVCKKIAERHNGLIFADGRLGEGSTFSIVIPKQQPTQHV